MTAMNDRIEQIEARAEAASEGPWVTGWDCQEFYVAPKSAGNDIYQRVAEWTYAIMPGRSSEMDECATEDAVFIANAREDVPYLLALVREQAAKLESLKGLADLWEANAGGASESARVFGPQKVSVNFAVEAIRNALDGFESGRRAVGEVEVLAHDVTRVGDTISYAGHVYVRAALTASHPETES